MSTGEIHRPHANGNGNGAASSVLVRIVAGLVVTATIGALAAWSDGRITAATLADQKLSLIEHKAEEQKRLDGLSVEIKALRDEMRTEMKEIRQAVERRPNR